ncbi:hypothetical protein JR316_0010413 [Psilocybe cubensis]|uniref:Uncharacterized protein n=2 Tax=Psilocybe cubensis TaxID=181762 RepID=A0A8H8CDW6_PSICU|nr:hypothetical protein JR316_0010413 [Psilocybe cubensis]KAH9476501.1 hypothetical protein JR316_0010413 [Psilocybe cubensis]
MATTIPLEIFEQIVDLIVSGQDIVEDKNLFRTLVACSLTSRLFSYAARKHLFSAIDIDQYAWQFHLQELRPRLRSEQEMSLRVSNFCNLLTDGQTNLGSAIRRLEIYVNHDRTMLHESSNLHNLLNILVQQAHNLNALKIHFRGRSHFPLSWKDVPTQIDRGIRALCRSLPINHLHFSRIVWIPSVIPTISQSPHLKSFSLIDSSFEREKHLSHSKMSFILEGCTDLWGNIPADCKYQIRYSANGAVNVTDIHADLWTPQDFLKIYRNLFNESVYTSVKTCHWIFHIDCVEFFMRKHLDFGTMVALQRLFIEQKPIDPELDGSHDRKTTRNLTSIVSFLYNGPQKSNLEELHLAYGICDHYSGGSTMSDITYECLVELRIDKLMEKFPRIRKVTFRMDIRLIWPQRLDHQKSLSGMHYKVVEDRVRSRILEDMGTNHGPFLPELDIRVHD